MDPITMSAIIAAGAQGIGNVVEGIGQERTNRQNKDIWKKTQDWQEYMSNTSWQRGVADMKKAGINPMLLVSKGVGASTPGGTTGAPMKSPTEGVSRGISSGISSAVQLSMLKKQLEQVESSTEVNRQQARKIEIDADNASKYAPLNKAISDGLEKVLTKLGLTGTTTNAKDLSGSDKPNFVSKAMGDLQTGLHAYGKKIGYSQ